MTDALDARRHAIAEARYEDHDFSPYRVEASDGWLWASGSGPSTYERSVFLVPPRADGTPGDVDTDASRKATFAVTFASDSATVVEVRASLDGEDVGHAGAGDDATLQISPTMALKAILARIDGRFDDPALLLFGPLMPERMDDIVHIAQEGLRTAEAA